MTTYKLLISDALEDKGIEVLKAEKNFTVDYKPKITPEELLNEIGAYDALIVRSRTKATKAVIEKGTRLKIIGRAGVGLDNVDLAAASAKGVIVANAPEGNTISTAEHAFGMLTSLSRNIPQADALMKDGVWEKKKFMGVEVYGKTLGVVGLGRIGSNVAKKALAYGMKVIAFDPYLSQEKAQQLGVEAVTIEDLFGRADYITFHVPLTEDTRDLVCARTIAKMKKGVRIINCARGGIVNEKDLAEAIAAGTVAGAALDVFDAEPIQADNPLLKLDRVILTPHLGASTEEAQTNVAIEIAEVIRDVLLGRGIRNAVNIPSLDAELAKVLEPYLNLAEKLGAMQAQMVDGYMKKVKITYVGDITKYDTTALTLAVIKGILTPILRETVNYVNAKVIAQERGIEVVESKAEQIQDFANLIIVDVVSDKGKNLLMGTLFTKKNPRIVRINEYYIDAAPSGYMLCISNNDVPGIVGTIGTILAQHHINIAGMSFGRLIKGGEAVSILNIDTDVSPAVLDQIRRAPNINGVRLIKV